MKTIDEVKKHCRFISEGIEKLVADGDILGQFGNEEMKVFSVTGKK